MSALLKLRIGVFAAGLSCLFMAYAWAQQEQQEQRTERTETETERQDARQTDRPQTLETREHRAEFRAEPRMRQDQDQQLTQYLAKRLIAINEAEIQTYELAQQHAESDQVKQFARDAAEEHQQLVQQLRQLAGQHDAPGQARPQQQQRGRDDAQRRELQQERDQLDVQQQQQTGLQQQREQRQLGAAARQDDSLNKLAEIDKKIVERVSEAVREELQEKRGAEFDKAFLGAQVASHMQMNAALEVLAQEGPDELQQIAQQARSDVQQHLQQAKQLREQLDERRPAARAAERDPARTR